MKPQIARTWLALLALLHLACATALADSFPSVKLLHTPDGGLQPQAVVDRAGILHLVYLKGDPKACDVFYVRWNKGAFSNPIRVNSRPGSAIAVGTVRGAQLALGRNAHVHVVWNGSSAAEPNPSGGTPMLYSRLGTTGAAFEPERNLMTSTFNLDGGGSVAADSRGRVYVVWHAHPKGVEPDEQNRAVFVALSSDDGQSFAAERKVSPASTGVCGCCGLKAFVDRRDRLEILYRSATAAGTRDATLLVSDDGSRTFKTSILGPWKMSTCPMSTMDLDYGPGDSVFSMWETAGQVYGAELAPDQLAAAPTRLVPGSNPGDRKHPTAAFESVGGPFVLMAWTEGTGWEKGGSLAWECVDLRNQQRRAGRAEGVVPVWGRVAAVALNGGFAIVY